MTTDGPRLAHVVAEFDYPFGNTDRLDDRGVVDAIKRIVVAGLWRSALSDYPDVRVILQPLPDSPQER